MKHTNLIVWTALMVSVCGASIEAASSAGDIDADSSEAASIAVSATVAATSASVDEESLSISHAAFIGRGVKRRKVPGEAAVSSVSPAHRCARFAAQREDASPTHAAGEASVFKHVLSPAALADSADSAELSGLLGGISVGSIARGAVAPAAAGAGVAEFRPLPVLSFGK